MLTDFDMAVYANKLLAGPAQATRPRGTTPPAGTREAEIAAFRSGLAALDATKRYPLGPGKSIHYTASDLAELLGATCPEFEGVEAREVVERCHGWAWHFEHPDCSHQLGTLREVERFCQSRRECNEAWGEVEIYGRREGHEESLIEAMGVGR